MKNKAPAVIALLVLLLWDRVDAQEPPPDKPRQIAINVFGEVRQPGRYWLPEGATILDALAAAGGQNSDADLKRSTLIHAVAKEQSLADKIDMKAVLEGVKAAPVLNKGDSLSIPRALIGIRF